MLPIIIIECECPGFECNCQTVDIRTHTCTYVNVNICIVCETMIFLCNEGTYIQYQNVTKCNARLRLNVNIAHEDWQVDDGDPLS